MQGEPGEYLQLDSPLWLTRAPGRLELLGLSHDVSGTPSLSVPLARSVYCAIQNREDQQIIIKSYLPESMGGTRSWQGEVSTLYTKKGPPRSLAVLRQTFSDPGDQWMMRVIAAMLGLRRTRQLNTPKHGCCIVIWSRMPNEPGFGQEAAFGTALSLALKAGTGLAKKRVDGVQVARAVIQGVREVLNEDIPLIDTLTSALGRKNCALYIEHGKDPSMQWIPLPNQCQLAAVHLGMEESTTEEHRNAIDVGAAMGLVHLNTELRKKKKDPIPSWGKVTPTEFEDDLRALVPIEQKGADFIKRFKRMKEYEDLFAQVEEERSYRLRALSDHQVRECARVRRMVSNFSEYGRTLREGFLVEAGRCLRSSHRSLQEKCNVSSEAADQYLAEVLAGGREEGMFGGRLSENGKSGVVATLINQNAALGIRELADKHRLKDSGTGRVLIDTEDGGVLTSWWEGVLNPPPEAEATEDGKVKATTEAKAK